MIQTSGTIRYDKETLKRLLEAERIEIEKYKWYLGIELNHDPLDDKSYNEICEEWIAKHAQEFREYWEKINGNSNK